MKHKKKNGRKLLSVLLTLALVLGLMPGMGLTAYATSTETLLTTITATGKEQANYSTANVATVSFSYTAGGSSAYLANWGWWGYGWTATVAPANGYTITKCVFYDDANRTATDSNAPFVVETTEDDKEPQVNGTTINSSSKGIKKIEVYGYATPAHTHSFTYSASGATITATCNGAGDCDLTNKQATLTIAAEGGTYNGTTAYSATVTNNIPAVTGDTVGSVAYYKVDTEGATTGGTAQTGAPTSAGYYYASVTLTSGSNTYTAVKAFTVAKANPTAPTGLTATYGQKLSDVALPTGWTWADSTQSVGNVVTPAATFKANFAGDDNYNAASNVDVAVTVSKAANPATVTSSASVTKGGNTVDLANNVTKNGATGAVSYEISGEANGCSLNGSVLTSGNNTGSVTVNVTVAEDGNYNALAATPITVTINAVPVTSVNLNTSSAAIAVDGTVMLTATVSPNDATDKKVKWSVSGAAVKLYADAACTQEVGTAATETLTVYAKGVSAGSATVTATSNENSNKYATCAVTVQKVPHTGDAADFGLWAAMLAVGLAGISFALTMGKRRKARQ